MVECIGQINIDIFIYTIFRLIDDKNGTNTKVTIKKVDSAKSTQKD